MTPPATCLDGGPRHAWKPTGLNVTVDKKLRHTARCVWCQQEASKPATAKSSPFRSGVRVRP